LEFIISSAHALSNQVWFENQPVRLGIQSYAAIAFQHRLHILVAGDADAEIEEERRSEGKKYHSGQFLAQTDPLPC